MKVVTTRFAPSPSGPLHVGHLLAAEQARHLADVHGGRCLLRIEDIDARAQDPRWLELLWQDLDWLGLHFDGEVMVQSQRLPIYRSVLHKLLEQGLIYPCFCKRGEIRAQVEAMGRAPHETLGYLYPGTCKHLPPDMVEERLQAGEPHTWRLDMERVQDLIGCPTWHDLYRGELRCVPTRYGDVVLGRKDVPASYHLCVVVDDAAQGVTHVTRGEDLVESTHIHRALQGVLGLPVPLYAHHRLLRDNQGRRLAKRDGARSLASLRGAGMSPDEVRQSLLRALEHQGIWRVES